MMRSIFNYKTNSIIEKYVEWSKYLNNASKKLLFSNILRDDQMIVCPVYEMNGIYDVQIGCTGKKRHNESFRMGMIRELDEELMISPRSKTDLVLFEKISLRNKIMTYVFTLDIKNTIVSNKSSDMQLTTNTRISDDAKSCVCCFIVGEMSDMMSYLMQCDIQHLGDKYIFDHIIGFSMVPVKQARQHVLDTCQNDDNKYEKTSFNYQK